MIMNYPNLSTKLLEKVMSVRIVQDCVIVDGSHYTNTMMVDLGVRLYFAAGSDKNIKLTTKDDLEMFKAYLKADKDTWLK